MLLFHGFIYSGRLQADALKRLRRFSIEVWNLTQNWITTSRKAYDCLENLINNRLRIHYARIVPSGSYENRETTELSSDQKKELLSFIIKASEEIDDHLNNLSRIVDKFGIALQRTQAHAQLYANSSNVEIKFIIDTLTSCIPDMMTMYKRELDSKRAGLRDLGKFENFKVFTAVCLSYKYEPFVDQNVVSRLYSVVCCQV